MKPFSFSDSVVFQVLSSLPFPFSLHDLHCIPSTPVRLLEFQSSCVQFLIGGCMCGHWKFHIIFCYPYRGLVAEVDIYPRRTCLHKGVGHNEKIMRKLGSKVKVKGRKAGFIQHCSSLYSRLCSRPSCSSFLHLQRRHHTKRRGSPLLAKEGTFIEGI
jgi:hypothetical protein